MFRRRYSKHYKSIENLTCIQIMLGNVHPESTDSCELKNVFKITTYLFSCILENKLVLAHYVQTLSTNTADTSF